MQTSLFSGFAKLKEASFLSSTEIVILLGSCLFVGGLFVLLPFSMCFKHTPREDEDGDEPLEVSREASSEDAESAGLNKKGDNNGFVALSDDTAAAAAQGGERELLSKIEGENEDDEKQAGEESALKV